MSRLLPRRELPHLAASVVVAVLLVNPGPANGQSDADAGVIESDEEGSAQSLQEQISAMERRFDEELGVLKEENAAQKKEISELKGTVEEIEDEQKMADLEQGSGEEYSVVKPISIHGFFDLTFSKVFYDEDSLFSLYTSPNGTFTMSNVNFYFLSQLTRTLGALVELRFSFLPHGQDEAYGSIARIGDREIVQGEYSRVDTTVRDPVTSEEYQPGGVTIERAHITYSPIDWFNVIAGRYLTPYGIWNIEHGSPVILAVRAPFTQIRELVPPAQTGLQLFGRFFPARGAYFDYGVTLSNGRGPIEQVIDLDENKGVGLRLKLTLERESFRIVAGSYGYTGTFTDTRKTMVVEMNPDMTVDMDASRPIRVETEVTEAQREYIATADLLVELFGLRLQGEYVWRYVQITEPTVRLTDNSILMGASALETVYEASFTGYGVYGLIAWELPLARWIHPVRITPYFAYEVSRPFDTLTISSFDLIIGGINLKPSPFLTLKAECVNVMPKSDFFRGNAPFFAAQMAVSF